MLSLTYFYSANDPDHKEISEQLKTHCQLNELVFVDICIDDHPEMQSKYKDKTPAVCIGPYVLHAPLSDTDLNVATKSAMERHIRLTEEKDEKYQERLKNGVSINNLDKFSFFFSRYYVLVISIIISLFVLIPFLAPVLKNSGHDRSANVIYKVYHVICHQLSFRSFFLYGEQAFYPRELAHIDGVITYEEITGRTANDLDFARNDIGNQLMGYKIAICERDIAIYGSLAIFGFLFQLTNKKIKQLQWYWWFVIALVPIAIDGVSQIPSLSANWPAWVPIRESTPLLRILTGTLFGAGTGWYMYPMMEESMKETRVTLHRKFTIIKKLQQAKTLVNDENPR